jgi:hypothetical protein
LELKHRFSSEEILKAEHELHASFDDWSADHERRPGNGLSALPYNPVLYPEQSILEARTEAEHLYPWLPDSLYYVGFKLKVAKSLGPLTVRRLVEQFEVQPTSDGNSDPLLQTLRNNQQEGKNTAVVSPHIKLNELAYLKALRFLAKKDRPAIDKSGTILNKLMTREAYRGKKLTDHFTPMGNIYWSIPRTESALQRNLPARATRMVGANMLQAMHREDMAAGGMEIDIAPTGSEMVELTNESGEITGYEYPFIDVAAASIITKFDHILPNSLYKNPDSGRWSMYIGDLFDVAELAKTMTNEEIVRYVFEDMRSGLENLTQKEILYRGIGSLSLSSVA